MMAAGAVCLPSKPSDHEISFTSDVFLHWLETKKSINRPADINIDKLGAIYDLEFKYRTVAQSVVTKVPIMSFSYIRDYLVKNNFRRSGQTNANNGDLLLAMGDGTSGNIAVTKSSSSPSKGASAGKEEHLHISMMSFGLDGFERVAVKNHLDRNPRISVFFCMNTNLNARINWNVFEMEGFGVYRQDLTSGNGGIMVYFKDTLQVSSLEDFEHPEFEAVWIKITHPEKYVNPITGSRDDIVTIVGNVCNKSESDSAEFSRYLSDCVRKVLNRYPKARIHIQGDLKYPGLGNSSVWAQFASPFQGKISPPRTFNCEGYQFLSYIRSSSFAEEAVKMDPENKKILTTTVKRHGCFLCDEGFITADELIQHRRSLRHRRNYCAHMYRLNRPELIKPKLGMKFDLGVKEEGAKYQAQAGKEGFEVVTEPKKEIEVKFLLRNVQETGDNVVLKSVELLESNTDYWLTDKYGVTKPVEMREPAIKPGVRVKPTRSFAFSFHARCDNIGQTRIPIVAQIRPDKGGSQLAHMAMELILKVESPDMDVIAPKTPFERPKRVNPFAKSALETAIPGLKLVFSSEKVKAKVALRQYPMPRDVKIFLASSGKIHDGLKSTEIPDIEKKNYLLRQKMSAENYCQRFQLLLYAEEKQMEVDIRRYDMSNVKMDLRPNKLFYLEVLGLAENRPSVLKGDSLIVNFNNDRTKTYEGVVHEVHDLGVLLGFSKRLADKFIPGNRFDVQFTFNRFPLRTMHRAVEHINVKNFMPIFPINPPVKAPKVNPASINFINRKIAHNLEQSEAVANIVKGDLIGAPYVVFGPPGTGKTVTVVEAMLQLYKTQKVRILACAPSNSAADLIAVRLLETVSPADILRIYAQSRDPKKVPESISKHRVSNFARPQCDGNFVEIMKYKVVVTTLVNAGRLLSAGIPKEHFTHLFIDEAGHATEPEAMIPIGLIDPAKGKIVLAGDPKQLGPVLRSPIALKHGLQLSYLERMMSSPEFRHYQPDKRGKYDPRFITKLLNNFRSHESILKLPSEMFYANELRVMADKDVREEFCKWEHLANPDFPIVFHSVIGEDKREGNSPSFFNPGEAAIVVEYLEKLINGVGRFKPKGKEIGVISPYRRQVQKIKDLMNHKFQRTRLDWKGITVGSTEEFQGQERRIIIISTVRSQEQYIRLDSDHQLGFLRNPKRFNVALTRAKALMIIVGNPNLLKLDPHWNRFIQYVFTNGGFKGSIPFEPWTGQQGDDGLKMLQEKMIRLGIYNGNDAEDDDEVEETSDLQLYAEPEWRADF